MLQSWHPSAAQTGLQRCAARKARMPAGPRLPLPKPRPSREWICSEDTKKFE